ncbi:hypothetical protein IWQ61_010037 [Dispira simplex]|nr:hypothetical protein IWQ61_010037 [Dispira simplex]
MVRYSILALAAIAMISVPAIMAAPVAPDFVSLSVRGNRKCKQEPQNTPTEPPPAQNETNPLPVQDPTGPIRNVEVVPVVNEDPETLPASTTLSDVPTGIPSIASPANQSGNAGEATFFTPGHGSCGGTNSETELVAALSAQFMQNPANPNNNERCGTKIRVTGASGTTVDAIIVDTCPECAIYDVDLSPKAFNAIANPVDGRVPVTWTLL